MIDVARQAGVAYSTAAKVLSGSGKNTRVSPATEARIRQVASAMKYEPNVLGRVLAGGKSHTIGVVISSLDAPVELANLQTIEETARAEGYVSFIACSNTRDARTTAFIERLLRRRVDGIIYFDTVRPYDKTLALLRGADVPVVFLDWGPPDWPARVEMPREAAMHQLGQHLKQLGHRRGVFLSDPYHRNMPHRQMKPLAQILRGYGIRLDTSKTWCRPAGSQFEPTAFSLVSERIAAGDVPPLIIAHNDQAALGTIWALQSKGYSVPKDTSVVGWDDLPISRVCQPSLTTIHQPRGPGPADAAMAMLLKQLREPDTPIEPAAVACELVIRESTAPPRREARSTKASSRPSGHSRLRCSEA